MALNLRRWCLALALALAATGVALLPPSGRPFPLFIGLTGPTFRDNHTRLYGPDSASRDSLQIALARRRDVLGRLEQRWHALAHRDTAEAYVARAARDTGAVRLVVDGPVQRPALFRLQQLRAMLESDLVVLGQSSIPNIIALRPGVTPRPSVWVAYPGLTRTPACVLALATDTAGTLIPPYHSLKWYAADCVYFGGFGIPGPAMSALLRSGGFAWLHGASFTGPEGTAPAGSLDLGWWRSVWTFWRQDEGWRQPLAPLARGCQVGRIEACLEVLGANLSPQSWYQLPMEKRLWGGQETPLWGDRLGEVGRRVFPDIAREFGPAALRTLWQSDRPLPESFRIATGRELGPWLAEYLPRKLGRTYSGPVLRLPSALLGLLVVSLVLVGASAWGNRRVVT